MLLYDLCTLDAFHIAHPPEVDSPLEKMTFIEPADDPRACVYLWAFHSNSNSAIAVLHSLTYELKILKQNGSGFVYKVSFVGQFNGELKLIDCFHLIRILIDAHHV